MLFNQSDAPKMPVPAEAAMHPAQHSKLHLDQFSHFYVAHGRESVSFFQCALKCV